MVVVAAVTSLPVPLALMDEYDRKLVRLRLREERRVLGPAVVDEAVPSLLPMSLPADVAAAAAAVPLLAPDTSLPPLPSVLLVRAIVDCKIRFRLLVPSEVYCYVAERHLK